MSAIRYPVVWARQISASSRIAPNIRKYHATPPARFAYKDTQDRESLKPSGTEGTKSGHDSDAATNNPDAAFNPSKTPPEEAKSAAGEELEFSGANQDMSKPQGDEKDVKNQAGSGKETRKGGTSGGGSPPKKGKPEP